MWDVTCASLLWVEERKGLLVFNDLAVSVVCSGVMLHVP